MDKWRTNGISHSIPKIIHFGKRWLALLLQSRLQDCHQQDLTNHTHSKRTLTCNTWPGRENVVVFVPKSASHCQQPILRTPNRPSSSPSPSPPPLSSSYSSSPDLHNCWVFSKQKQQPKQKMRELGDSVCVGTVPGRWLPWRGDVAHARSASSATGRPWRCHSLRCGFYWFLSPQRGLEVGRDKID